MTKNHLAEPASCSNSAQPDDIYPRLWHKQFKTMSMCDSTGITFSEKKLMHLFRPYQKVFYTHIWAQNVDDVIRACQVQG